MRNPIKYGSKAWCSRCEAWAPVIDGYAECACVACAECGEVVPPDEVVRCDSCDGEVCTDCSGNVPDVWSGCRLEAETGCRARLEAKSKTRTTTGASE